VGATDFEALPIVLLLSDGRVIARPTPNRSRGHEDESRRLEYRFGAAQGPGDNGQATSGKTQRKEAAEALQASERDLTARSSARSQRWCGRLASGRALSDFFKPRVGSIIRGPSLRISSRELEMELQQFTLTT